MRRASSQKATKRRASAGDAKRAMASAERRDVGVQVERLRLAAPGVARQHRQRLQPHQRVERGADLGQDLVEDPAHREHGRAGVDRGAVDVERAHLAAGRIAGFEQRHVEAARGQQQRRDDAADAGADDDDAVRRRHAAQPWSHAVPVAFDVQHAKRTNIDSLNQPWRCARCAAAWCAPLRA